MNTLKNTVKILCAKVGLQGHYTNHSLRGTSATRMYQSGIPEKVITEVTGHRSNAVRSYMRMDFQQKESKSAALTAKTCGQEANSWKQSGL